MTSNSTQPDETLFAPNRKKKSRKRISHEVQPETTALADCTNHMVEDEIINDSENDYSYQYLITRAFDIIHSKNGPSPGDHESRLALPPPELGRVGSKRTSFTNFGLICKYLNRQEKILYHHFIVELGTTASIDAHHALIIKGRLNRGQIENILRSFIREYVLCKTCRSPDTLLGKTERLTRIKCKACHSEYSVSSIRTGFQAQLNRRT